MTSDSIEAAKPLPSSARVRLALPQAADQDAFLAAVRRSSALHAAWVAPPNTPEAYQAFLAKSNQDTQASFLLRAQWDGALVGVANISQMARGNFCSAYLGFYAFQPLAGQGLMREGLALVLSSYFQQLAMHRIEANVQPNNARSLALIERLGFRREGFSPRYLKIAGQWRDHLRYAMTLEDYQQPLALEQA